MAKHTPVIRCVFSTGGRELPELLEESFRLYLRQALAPGGEREAGDGPADL